MDCIRNGSTVGMGVWGTYTRVAIRLFWFKKTRIFLMLARYVVQNPVRAGMVRSARDWPWSSYRAMIKQASSPTWLTTDWLLLTLSYRRTEAIERYKAFVSEGKNQASPWGSLQNQIYLGTERFVEEMQRKLGVDRNMSEVPSIQRRSVAKPLAYYDERHRNRNEAIAAAYSSGAYNLREIGEYFGLHYSRVSRVVRMREIAKGKT